jgi:hypothetical protein
VVVEGGQLQRRPHRRGGLQTLPATAIPAGHQQQRRPAPAQRPAPAVQHGGKPG